ncbi:MAG TPA: aldehyde dehydrogenase family protein [Gammaproteobacteria bacterium]|nr:aldehyde dehydrogenase family protein [Gammaproteobacteria bacterium]
MRTPAESAASGVTLHAPASGAFLGHFPWQSAADVRAALRTAHALQPEWAAITLSERRACIAGFRQALLQQIDEVAHLIADCVGKTRVDALATEIMPALTGSRWYERHAHGYLRPRRLKNGSLLYFNKRSTLYRVPWGVVGIIAPWNYPLGIPVHEILPALLAGNTVVFKTAPETLPVGSKIADLLRLAGVPPGVFQHINIDGPTCGDLWLEAGGVDKLFFTGSVRVGKLLAEKAARALVPVSLELGGKDAMIVCADADLERAAAGAVWAGLSNAGQSCAGVERIYVHRQVYAPFMALLAQKVAQLRTGRDTDFNVDVGALCTERQIETVRRHLQGAIHHGARVAAQGEPPANDNAHFVPAVVLCDVNHGMAVMREETFGPVLGVMPVGSDAQAVQLANDSSYGLMASVWSRDRHKAARLARQIQAGAIMVNDHLLSHAQTETPWGGFKDSGNSRGHGQFAFEAVTTPKVIVNDWLRLMRHQPYWMPYSAQVYVGLKGILLGLYARRWRDRLAGFKRALVLLPRMFGSR